MMIKFSHLRLGLPLSLALLLGACETLPEGPTVAVMPPSGKPLDLFQQEDLYCRNYATQSLGPQAAQKGNSQVLSSALIGSAVGALLGNALGGNSRSAGTGAAMGLAMGGMVGSGNAQDTSMSYQDRYNIAYEQCMSTKGNIVPQQLPERRVRIQYQGGYYGYPGW